MEKKIVNIDDKELKEIDFGHVVTFSLEGQADYRAEKIKYDYDGDVSKITDLIRGRIVVEAPEQIELVRTELAALQRDGWQL